MNLCSHNHDEIAFEGSKCPFCEFKQAAHEREQVLNDTIADRDNEIFDLNAELKAYQEPVVPALKKANGVA